jgi:hypothetical protein
MSWATVRVALHTRLQQVLAAEQVTNYVPRVFGALPALYTVLDGFERERAGQLTVMRYTATSTLVVRWQDFEEAENELEPFVNSIAAAIDSDATLGGAVNIAYVSEGNADWLTVGAGTANPVTYRILQLTTVLTEKAAYRSGI